MPHTIRISNHYFWCGLLPLTAQICFTQGLLLPPGEVWVSKFEPPYDNRTLLIELAVYDWWTNAQNNAIMNAGTEFAVLDGNPWRLPSNVTLSFGPASPQQEHHLAIFLTDTGTRLSIPLAPTESATSGCTAAPSNASSTSTACCPVTNEEWTLDDGVEEFAAYVMWTARPNGTLSHNGTQPPNFFFGGAELNVTAGFYSAKVSWPNMFFESTGVSSDPKHLTASINFAVDTYQSSYLDVISTLTSQYLLLLPACDPTASGFVAPKSLISSMLLQQNSSAQLVQQWNACRSSSTNCSEPTGDCIQGLETRWLPLTPWLGTTAADVVANSWNALGRGINKTCYVVGNGEQPYIHSNFTVGASHLAQYINCDYVGTYLVPTISLSTNVVMQGAPPPPNQHLHTPPVFLPPSRQGQITSPQATPPTSSPFAGQGVPVSIVIMFPDYTEASFNKSGPSDIIAAIQASVIGLTSTPWIRIRSVNGESSTAAGGRRLTRSLLAAGGTSGVVVDAVITFAPADATPASAFVSLLQSSPSTVFPPDTFGNVVVQRAVVLNCIIPCGPHGNPAPSVVGQAVTCTCDCNMGWVTLRNQPFDSFAYCSSPSMNSTRQSNGSSAVVPSGVPVPPPPAPYALQPGGSSSPRGISVGAIVAIAAVVVVGGIVLYIAWKTRCCCFCKVLSLLGGSHGRDTGQMPAMPMPAVEPVLAPGIKTTSNGQPTAATPTVVHVEAQSMGTSHIQGLTFAKHPGHPADSHQKTAFAKKGKHGKSRTRQDKKVARPGVTSLT